MRMVLFFVWISLCSTSYAQRLKIAVFYNQKISSVVLNVYLGNYQLITDQKQVITLQQNETIQATVQNDSIELKTIHGNIIKTKQVEIKGTSNQNTIKYKPVVPSLAQRYYDDDMIISIQSGFLFFINLVEMENYICGVVESESGYQASKEFYKTQAILARTFALENLGKHYTENFHLCDGVHCQAYKGKNYSLSAHSIISEAVEETRNLVVIDSTGMVISASFHANCGGQTMNSEDVWGSVKSYLRSVNDSFCQYQRNTYWEKKISVSEWLNFLQSQYPSLSKNYQPSIWNFNQTQRKSSLTVNNTSVSLRKIREYFQLRSTYFSIEVNSDSLIFKGKGFGHGVGLCQDGAIQMAERGYKAEDIIKYYYMGVRVVSYLQLPFYQSILTNE